MSGAAAAAELGAERIATSLDILIWAVRQGRIDVAAAERLLDRLDVGSGIRRELDRKSVEFRDVV